MEYMACVVIVIFGVRYVFGRHANEKLAHAWCGSVACGLRAPV